MNAYVDAFKNYANFSGRTSRRGFWMFVLFNLIVTVVLVVIDMVAGTKEVLSGVYALAAIIPSLAIAVRRLHDNGRTGWFVLLALIPVVSLVLLFFYCQVGAEDDNAYGPAPVAAA